MWFRLLAPLLLLCVACDSGPPPACDPDRQACTLSHDFGVTTLMPGAEIASQCNSWTLNNPTDLWVNAVVMDNGGAHHHSNWFFVPDKNYDVPDGKWECGSAHFAEVEAAILGGVLFAQSTQSRHEAQKFPAGAVVHIPAYARVIGEVHLLNASGRAVDAGLQMQLQTLPPPAVTVKLTPMRLTYHDLHLPPGRSSEFGATCDLRHPFENLRKEPFRLQLFYVLPHYHVLGRSFRLRNAGGPASGMELYSLAGGYGEANGKTFDPPVDLGQADGFEFVCGFDNPGTKEVGWGIGDQEMCVMLGFIHSPVGYDAVVDKDQVADQATARHTGPCQVAAYNFAASQG